MNEVTFSHTREEDLPEGVLFRGEYGSVCAAARQDLAGEGGRWYHLDDLERTALYGEEIGPGGEIRVLTEEELAEKTEALRDERRP